MTKAYQIFYNSDIKDVFNAYQAAVTNQNNMIYHSASPSGFSFYVKSSLKYNMNNGTCSVTLSSQENGTVVQIAMQVTPLSGNELSVHIDQLVGKRCEAYVRDMNITVANILNSFSQQPINGSYGQTFGFSPPPVNEIPFYGAPMPQTVPFNTSYTPPQPTSPPASDPENEMIICPSCGQETHKANPFCDHCDIPLNLAAETCVKCGAVRPPNAVFCTACGNKF